MSSNLYLRIVNGLYMRVKSTVPAAFRHRPDLSPMSFLFPDDFQWPPATQKAPNKSVMQQQSLSSPCPFLLFNSFFLGSDLKRKGAIAASSPHRSSDSSCHFTASPSPSPSPSPASSTRQPSLLSCCAVKTSSAALLVHAPLAALKQI